MDRKLLSALGLCVAIVWLWTKFVALPPPPKPATPPSAATTAQPTDSKATPDATPTAAAPAADGEPATDGKPAADDKTAPVAKLATSASSARDVLGARDRRPRTRHALELGCGAPRSRAARSAVHRALRGSRNPDRSGRTEGRSAALRHHLPRIGLRARPRRRLHARALHRSGRPSLCLVVGRRERGEALALRPRHARGAPPDHRREQGRGGAAGDAAAAHQRSSGSDRRAQHAQAPGRADRGALLNGQGEARLARRPEESRRRRRGPGPRGRHRSQVLRARGGHGACQRRALPHRRQRERPRAGDLHRAAS